MLGMAGVQGTQLPARMAEINEVLNALPVRLRERLLTEFIESADATHEQLKTGIWIEGPSLMPGGVCIAARHVGGAVELSDDLADRQTSRLCGGGSLPNESARRSPA